MEQKKITLPKGWEIDKVEGNEIILKEIKKELPKTWFACLCKYKGDLEYISSINSTITPHVADGFFPECDKNLLPKGLGKPMLAFMQLLVCREVYRAGWKPDWNNGEESKYVILYENDFTGINVKTHFATKQLLSFQSKEIRDKFLENFRDLIEEAKELI